MKRISMTEARTHLCALLRDVEAGTSIILTRNGKPVAEIQPHQHHGVDRRDVD
jgi:prevent-host-death family protein